MNPFIKALRHLVPGEIKALLEKIDAFDTLTDSSSYPTKDFVRNAKLTRLERFLLRDALHRIERRDVMVQAMTLVINEVTAQSYMFAGSHGLYTSTNGNEAMRTDSSGNLGIGAQSIYQAAEQARQAAVAQENLQRKKVVVRVRPAAQ